MAHRTAAIELPKHLMTLADLTPVQIDRLLVHSHYLKHTSKPWLAPMKGYKDSNKLRLPPASLFNKSIAMLFSKRSTRTRLAAETATNLLGGQSIFLGKDDIQLGVNETASDSAKVIGRMCQGIFARVGDHSEIETLALDSPVPVINALSSLWHPTQVLADLLTLREHAAHFTAGPVKPAYTARVRAGVLANLPKLTVAYVGDSANVLHDMMVTYPRMGCQLRIAVPPQAQYQPPQEVWDRVADLGCRENIWLGNDPLEAVKGADVVITDTWISMGQEAEKEQRLKDFKGYQVTEKMCADGGAKENWMFMHCLPRKADEVDDGVFHGPRSVVWDEAENRKWTIMALFDTIYGKWDFGMDRAVLQAKTKSVAK